MKKGGYQDKAPVQIVAYKRSWRASLLGRWARRPSSALPLTSFLPRGHDSNNQEGRFYDVDLQLIWGQKLSSQWGEAQRSVQRDQGQIFTFALAGASSSHLSPHESTLRTWRLGFFQQFDIGLVLIFFVFTKWIHSRRSFDNGRIGILGHDQLKQYL